MKKIAVVYPTRSGATIYFRLDLPFRRFKKFEIVPYYLPDAEDLPNYNPIEFIKSIKEDLVIFHRTNYVNQYLIESLKKMHNKKIIFDTDDLEICLPWDHPLRGNYPSDVIRDFLVGILRHSDEVWVTTNSLKRAISKFGTTKIIVIKNAIDSTESQWKTKKVKNDKITIGWVGGTSHLPDLPVCVKGLNKLCEEFNFDLKICGIPDKQASIITSKKYGIRHVLVPVAGKDLYENRIKDLFKIFDKKNRLKLMKVLPLEKYATFYDDMDIVVAPLAINAFNDAKSELKILEAGSKGLPIVCSNSKTYWEFNSNYRDTILLANNYHDWYKKIKSLIESEELRVNKGKRLKEVVEVNYDLDYWAELREQRILEVLNQ